MLDGLDRTRIGSSLTPSILFFDTALSSHVELNRTTVSMPVVRVNQTQRDINLDAVKVADTKTAAAGPQAAMSPNFERFQVFLLFELVCHI